MSKSVNQSKAAQAKRSARNNIAPHLLKGVFNNKAPQDNKDSRLHNRSSYASYFQSHASPSKTVKAYPNLVVVNHEEKVNWRVNSPDRKRPQSPRNPILQEKPGDTKEWKPQLRIVKNPNHIMKDNRDRPHGKARGQCFQTATLQHEPEVKIKVVRTKMLEESKSDYEINKQSKKMVKHFENMINPITQDGRDTKYKPQRIQKSDYDSSYRAINDRMYLAGFERPNSHAIQNRPRDNLGYHDGSLAPGSPKIERINRTELSPQQKKMRGSIQGLITYQFGGKFRDEALTSKCTNTNYNIMQKTAQHTDRSFIRKKAEWN